MWPSGACLRTIILPIIDKEAMNRYLYGPAWNSRLSCKQRKERRIANRLQIREMISLLSSNVMVFVCLQNVRVIRNKKPQNHQARLGSYAAEKATNWLVTPIDRRPVLKSTSNPLTLSGGYVCLPRHEPRAQALCLRHGDTERLDKLGHDVLPGSQGIASTTDQLVPWRKP